MDETKPTIGGYARELIIGIGAEDDSELVSAIADNADGLPEYKEWDIADSNLYQHALRELEAAGYKADDTEDGPNKWMREAVLELLTVFAKQGHSGSSAPYCISIFKTLAMFEPLTPLQGTDDEWFEFIDGEFQNKRCSHVFKKGKDGVAYDIDGKIFREPNGCTYTSFKSRTPLTFPYTPKSVYVDVDMDGNEIVAPVVKTKAEIERNAVAQALMKLMAEGTMPSKEMLKHVEEWCGRW